MKRERLIKLLQPLVEMKKKGDFTPEEWYNLGREVTNKIPEVETGGLIELLESMIHNPFDPESTPEREIPGAHIIRQHLMLRQVSSRESKESKE